MLDGCFLRQACLRQGWPAPSRNGPLSLLHGTPTDGHRYVRGSTEKPVFEPKREISRRRPIDRVLASHNVMFTRDPRARGLPRGCDELDAARDEHLSGWKGRLSASTAERFPLSAIRHYNRSTKRLVDAR
jgi:hypothetical protein